jgi:pyruvate dehydrogenase E2 component (dihydrolipoamide acetyltransferase)
MSAPGAAVDPRTAEALAALRAVPGQTEVLVELAGAISADDRQGAFPTAMLAGLACPLAIAWGRADPVLPFAQTANLPAGARLVAIDGAGHMLIEEAPALVGQLIAAALS